MFLRAVALVKRVEFTPWNYNHLQNRIKTGQTPLPEERMRDYRDYGICFLDVERKCVGMMTIGKAISWIILVYEFSS